MAEPSEDAPWTEPGEPASVVVPLLQKLGMHSPDLTVLLQHYLGLKEEGLADRMTYSGGDPSLLATFFLLEVLLNCERLRLELMDQAERHHGKGMVPPEHLIAMSELLKLEPALIANLSSAFEIHLQLWGATADHYFGTMASGPKTPPNHVEKEERGRWDVSSNDRDPSTSNSG